MALTSEILQSCITKTPLSWQKRVILTRAMRYGLEVGRKFDFFIHSFLHHHYPMMAAYNITCAMAVSV